MMIGKTAFDFVESGESMYENRLKHYCSFQKVVLSDVKNAKNFSHQELKKKEGELFLDKFNKTDFVILLDENGIEFSSRKFADFIEKKALDFSGEMVFVIGGAFGFSDQMYERANSKISLSQMTFSHQLVRVLFLEQLYRAFTIIKGESYHHD